MVEVKEDIDEIIKTLEEATKGGVEPFGNMNICGLQLNQTCVFITMLFIFVFVYKKKVMAFLK